MQSIDLYGTFEVAIEPSSPQARALAQELRALIAGVYPEAVEVPWPNQRVIGYGVGPRKKSEHFCYIGAHARPVNLGFNQGARLADPARLLEGSGKAFRHVKIRTPEDAARPALRQLIEAAVEERKAALQAGKKPA